MKKLVLAFSSIGLTLSAFAALPAASDPTLVNVPQLPGGIVAGISGYYLKNSDSNGDLDYALANVLNASGTPISVAIKNLDSDYSWGWGANLGYIFPNTGNDVNISYFHFDNDDNDSTAGLFNTLVPISGINYSSLIDFVAIDTITSSSSQIAIKSQQDIDQVDLTFGQYINVGCRTILHPNVGVRWGSIDQKLATISTAHLQSGTGERVARLSAFSAAAEKSNYDGIGPVGGLDASYYLGAGFGVVGHFNAALLIGQIDSNNDINGSFLGVFSGVTIVNSVLNASEKTDSTTRIVPAVDGKLGLDYTFVFNNTQNSDLTLEAGWHAANYFNAIDRTIVNFAATPIRMGATLSYAPQLQHFTSDLSLNGPYASLTLHI